MTCSPPAVLAAAIAVACGTPRQPLDPPATQAHAESRPIDELSRRLEEIDARIGQITDLRADFEQRKITALLKQPLASSGSLLVKGSRVRWDTLKPRPSTMTIADGEIRIYYPEAAIVEIYNAGGDVRELTGSPLPRLASLRRHFDIARDDPRSLGGADGDGFIALRLTPKTEELKEHLTSVGVLMDAKVPCIRKLIMTDADGDTTEIEFNGVRINRGIDDGSLELKLPAGTRTSRLGGRGDAGRAASTQPASEPQR